MVSSLRVGSLSWERRQAAKAAGLVLALVAMEHSLQMSAWILPQSQSVRPQAVGRGDGVALRVTSHEQNVPLLGLGAVGLLASFALRPRNQPEKRKRHRLHAVEGDAELGDVEKVFKEAYEAEAQRCELIRAQLQKALSEKLGGEGGVTISIEGAEGFAPDKPGGKSTWREAFEATKIKIKTIEDQLAAFQKENQPSAPQVVVEDIPQVTPPATPSTQQQIPGVDNQAALQQLEKLAETIEDQALLRLIVNPIVQPDPQKTNILPAAQTVRDLIGADQFSIRKSDEWNRVYVFTGSLAAGKRPKDALAVLEQRLSERGLATSTEISIQKVKDSETEQLLVMVLKEDLPDQGEFQWYNWLLFAVALVFTLVTVNMVTFSVTTGNMEEMAKTMSPDQIAVLAQKNLPTAVSLFATVAASELARRVAAASYGVKMAPPIFVPVVPFFPSAGVLGAVSRKQSTPPDENANIGISAAASLAGIVVSLAFVAIGFAQGPDPDKFVNLNFNILPLVFKLILKPLLGTPSATIQPDQFADPVILAFASNGWQIGGLVGLVVTALNLLPIGKLDGGIMARGALGGTPASIAGFLAVLLILLGSSNGNESGALYVLFGIFAVVVQGGTEPPPKDGISEPDGVLKAVGVLLVTTGIFLSIPPGLMPNL